MSTLATVAQKSFNGKFTAKNDFSIGHFYVTIADADIGSLKPLHTLDHMLVKFEQNRMVRTIQSFVLFDKKKIVHHFWQSVDAIFLMKTFLWLKQLFDAKILIYRRSSLMCSKYYGSPAHVTG